MIKELFNPELNILMRNPSTPYETQDFPSVDTLYILYMGIDADL